MANSVAKNTMLMTIGSIGQKVISFVYFTMIARMIGVEGTGKYFVAISFTTIFVVFVDMGFTSVMVREVAKAKSRAQRYLSTVLASKLWFGALTYLAVLAFVFLLGYEVELRNMILVSGITMLFDSLHLTLYGVFRSFGRLKFEAMSIIATQFGTLILGSIFLFTGMPLIYLMLAFTIPSIFNALYAGLMLVREYKIYPRIRFDKKVFRIVGRIAIPFALAAIFARVYSYIDSLMILKFAGTQAAGWYSIPVKISTALLFVPGAFIASLYPRFSECFVSSKKHLSYVFEQAIIYVLLIAFPAAVGVIVLAKDIVLFVYGSSYLPSVLPLQIMMVSMVFTFVFYILGAFLNACNRQVAQTVIVGVVMIGNIILNLLLIPMLGIVGAAMAALVTNLALTVSAYMIAARTARISHGTILLESMKMLAAALLMGLAVLSVRDLVPLIGAILFGAISYVAFLFAFRILSRAQIKEMVLLLRRS